MQTKSFVPTPQMPRYPLRFAMGLLVLLLTLLLLATAVASTNLFTDERCQTTANTMTEEFSAETAVPSCWLTQ